MALIRTAQKQDFKFLSNIFFLNVPKYFDKKELDDFKRGNKRSSQISRSLQD